MTIEIKRMDLNEFRDQGFLQEVNRRFFHPLGLALQLIVDDTGKVISFGGIRDFRDDPEGLIFSDEDFNAIEFGQKKERIDYLLCGKAQIRNERYGFVIQDRPVESSSRVWQKD